MATIHRGRHTKDYDDEWTNFLDGIEKQLDSRRISKEKAEALIAERVQKVRGELKRGDRSLNAAGASKGKNGAGQSSETGLDQKGTETPDVKTDDSSGNDGHSLGWGQNK